MLLVLLGASAHADVQYVYDNTGQVVQVIAADGSSAQYQYDSAGNITAINRLAAGQLAITAFSPSSGSAGSTVTIFGSGFSATANQNTVQFNGTSAVVATASASQLTVTVPVGASTGPISITTPGGSVTSSSSFTVTTALTISSFVPAAAPAGTLVTINGAGFDTTLINGRIRLNNVTMAPSTASATQLQFTVPANTGSGRISVSTLSDTVTSASDFVVLPSGYSAAEVVNARATVGSALSVSIANTQRLGLLTFEGVKDAYYSLNLANFASTPAGASVTATILKPDGTSLLNCGTYSATAGNCDFGPLPSSGTYAVRIDTSGTTAFAFNLVVTQDLTASLVLNGSPVSHDVAVLGQNKRYTFSASAGQSVSLALTNNTIAAGTLFVHKPDGSLLVYAGSYGGSASKSVDLGALPVTGTYTAVLYVDRVATGHIDVSAVTDATGSTAVDGTPTSVSLLGGQNASYSFSGVAGQAYSLILTNLSTTPGGGSVAVTIRNPDGSTARDCGTFTATTGNCDTFPLASSGTHTVFIDPAGTSATSFNIVLSADLVGTLAFNAAPVGYDVAVLGQNKRYTLSASAGQSVSLALTNNTIAAGSLFVYKPDGSLLVYAGNYGGSVSKVADLGALPVTGTYTVILYVDRVATGHVDVSAVTDATGSTAVDGTPTPVSLLSGQNASYSFNGIAGQGYSLILANLTTTPGGGSVAVTIRNPNGSTARDCGIFTATTGNCDTYPLTSSGTYTIFIDPAGTSATSFNMVLSADLAGTLVINGSSSTYNATVPGQNIRYSFTGAASQQVSWHYSNNTIGTGTMVILLPNGSTLTGYLSYGGTTSGTLSATLPVAGTYIGVVFVDRAATGHIDLQLQSP